MHLLSPEKTKKHMTFKKKLDMISCFFVEVLYMEIEIHDGFLFFYSPKLDSPSLRSHPHTPWKIPKGPFTDISGGKRLLVGRKFGEVWGIFPGYVGKNHWYRVLPLNSSQRQVLHQCHWPKQAHLNGPEPCSDWLNHSYPRFFAPRRPLQQ